MSSLVVVLVFFFNDTATTEIYTLSLHDALPICSAPAAWCNFASSTWARTARRSEEHTSELQSRGHLVCRLLLEKKKNTPNYQSGGQLVCRLMHQKSTPIHI